MGFLLLSSVQQPAMMAYKEERSHVSQHRVDVITESSLKALKSAALDYVRNGILGPGVK